MKPIAGIALALAVTAAGLLAALPATAGPVEQKVSIGGLAASYVRPEDSPRVPLAVIIAGSGPTDRDGNGVPGLQTDSYKLLAYALAELGIATVRYDKRGIGGSVDLVRSEDQLTIDVYAKDAAAVAAWGRLQTGIASVVLVGHSEGGVLALLAARQTAAKAVVLLATPGRPLGAVLRDQLERPALPAELRAEALTIIAALERGEQVKTMRTDLEPLFRPSVQPFLRSWIRTDPAELLRGLVVPVLVIGGGRDIQVGRADFDALTAARANIKGHWYPHMGHTLKLVGEDAQSQGRAYMDRKIVLAEGLAEWVAAFIHEAAGAATPGRK
jgi:pimeloyl-ACP methyl ester carboxylesterase